MDMSPATIALIAAVSSIIGAMVSSLFNLWNTWLNKKYELRRHQQQLAMQAAIESWKKIAEIAIETSKAKKEVIWIPPIETYIFRMVR